MTFSSTTAPTIMKQTKESYGFGGSMGPIGAEYQLFVDEIQQKGSGIQYVDNWKTYYDEENGWICIGNPQCENGVAVEFAQNTLAVIDNRELKAIWIKPEFIK